MTRINKKQSVPIIGGIAIAGLLCILFIFNFLFESRSDTVTTIVNDLRTLTEAFASIDKTCGIVSFDQQKSVINFLNTTSFVGSEVGPMNLRYPKKWKGPYVADNPTIQGKEYQVVRTTKGHFITPGDGVKLPGGKIVGKDIILDENADIATMMHQKNVLLFDNQSLAAPLIFSAGETVLFAQDDDYCC